MLSVMFVCWEDGLAGNKLGNLAPLLPGSHFPVASPVDALMMKAEERGSRYCRRFCCLFVFVFFYFL